ncbi:MAG: hypothetical protein WAM14_05635 [Candidatus Nitrosopolaris sp.]
MTFVLLRQISLNSPVNFIPFHIVSPGALLNKLFDSHLEGDWLRVLCTHEPAFNFCKNMINLETTPQHRLSYEMSTSTGESKGLSSNCTGKRSQILESAL